MTPVGRLPVRSTTFVGHGVVALLLRLTTDTPRARGHSRAVSGRPPTGDRSPGDAYDHRLARIASSTTNTSATPR